METYDVVVIGAGAVARPCNVWIGIVSWWLRIDRYNHICIPDSYLKLPLRVFIGGALIDLVWLGFSIWWICLLTSHSVKVQFQRQT